VLVELDRCVVVRAGSAQVPHAQASAYPLGRQVLGRGHGDYPRQSCGESVRKACRPGLGGIAVAPMVWMQMPADLDLG
jgi:hypothetical protein